MSRRRLSLVAPLAAALMVASLNAPGGSGRSAAQEASPALATCPTSTTDDNKSLVRRLFEEGWGQGDVAVLDEVLGDEFVLHVPHLAGLAADANLPESDQAALTQAIQEFRTGFPDLQVTIEDLVAEGDRVAMRATFSGTQADSLASWRAPNTGRQMARENWVFAQVACGKLHEMWVLPDNLTLLRQLGIITDNELGDFGTPTVATPIP